MTTTQPLPEILPKYSNGQKVKSVRCGIKPAFVGKVKSSFLTGKNEIMYVVEDPQGSRWYRDNADLSEVSNNVTCVETNNLL